jgi:hypothetical protein
MKTINRTAYFALLFVGIGLIFTPQAIFAYQGAPSVTTLGATFVTEKSARVSGQVNANEMPDTYQWFEWGVVGRDDRYDTTHAQLWWGQRVDTSAEVIGLAPNTQYFYRQISENGRGRTIGATLYFTTKPYTPPISPIVIVRTNPAAGITEGSATLKGYVSPHGDVTAKWWFQWGLSNTFENETPHSGRGGSADVVETMVSGLTPGTVYFYRVVGENSLGRVYGATQVFVTLGVPPPPPETPRDQAVSEPHAASDGVSRTITTTGTPGGGSANNAPFSFAQNRPGDFFGALFRPKQTNTGTPVPSEGAPVTNATNQGSSVGVAGGPLGAFWGSLTGKKSVALVVEKVGPKSVPAHTPVEYRITYAYRLSGSAVDAKLKITLPGEVIYVGDTTTNELLVEDGVGPERTYVLPIGRLENGETRTISILGITTGAKSGFPDVRTILEYTDARGSVFFVEGEIAGAVKGAAKSSLSGASPGILPDSFLGWFLYVLFVVGVIVGVRKAKVYYEKRKEEIMAAEHEEAESRTRETLPQNPARA